MKLFFDGMIAHMFRPDAASGQTIFFPNGAIGRGYVLPDTATEHRMRRNMRWVMITVLVFSIGVMQILTILDGSPPVWPRETWLIALSVFAFVMLGWLFILRRLVAGLAVSEQRLSLPEAFTAQTLGLPRWYFYMMAVVGPLLMVGSILCLISATSFMERIWAVVGLLLFAIATIQAFAGLRLKPDEPGSADRA